MTREHASLRSQRLKRKQERAHRHYVAQLVIDAISRDDRVGGYALQEIVDGVGDARADLARAFGLEDGD